MNTQIDPEEEPNLDNVIDGFFLKSLPSKDLRNWFREFHMSRLTTDQQNDFMWRATDEELIQLTLMWKSDDLDTKWKAKELFEKIWCRPIMH